MILSFFDKKNRPLKCSTTIGQYTVYYCNVDNNQDGAYANDCKTIPTVISTLLLRSVQNFHIAHSPYNALDNGLPGTRSLKSVAVFIISTMVSNFFQIATDFLHNIHSNAFYFRPDYNKKNIFMSAQTYIWSNSHQFRYY